MFRDTLEMIPVAIIMTLILSFGMRTGRVPTLPGRPAPLAIRATAAEPVLPSLGGETRRTSEAMNATSAVGERASDGEAATVASEMTPRLFIERIPARNGVPFYTSRDIAAFQREHGRRHVAKNAGHRVDDVARRPAAGAGKRLVALNHASLGELRRIPGVGPVKAQALIDRRPRGGYKSWQEIDRVPGIGAGMIATMQLHATLD
jgi:hypothetical protein